LEDDELRKASRELFDEIDADKSGSISAAELEMLYKKMGLAFPVAEINQLIQEVDTDNSGQI
jgi:Ca2+-binding EF-hand superfamily protein